MYTLINTAKLNGVDPQAWLTDVPRPHRRHAVVPAPPAPPLELGSSRHRVKSGVNVALGVSVRADRTA